MGCCCGKPKDTWSNCLGVFPLCFVALVIGIVFLIMGTLRIVAAATSANPGSFAAILQYLIGVFVLLGGIGSALVAVIPKQKFASMGACGFKFTVMLALVGAVEQIIYLIIEASKKDSPNTAGFYVASVVIQCLVVIFMLLLLRYVLSVYASIGCIIVAGGTGWEKKSYLDLRAEKKGGGDV